jgi:hypothetical protein
MLSGLVVVRSLERFNYRARPFLIARAARIFPVVLPVFVLAMAVQPLSVGVTAMPWIGSDSAARLIWSDGWPAAWATELLAHLVMLHGLLSNAVLPDAWVSFLGAAWSLSTEWQFYAPVALIGARFGRGERGLWRQVALLLGVALTGVAWQEAVPSGWQFSRAFLPNKAMYFALGVASAALPEDLRVPWRFLAVLGVVLTLCLVRDNPLKALVPLAWGLCLRAIRPRPIGPAPAGTKPVGTRPAGSRTADGSRVARPAHARRVAEQHAPALARVNLILPVSGERTDSETVRRGTGPGGGWDRNAVHPAVAAGCRAAADLGGLVAALSDRNAGFAPRQDAGGRGLGSPSVRC